METKKPCPTAENYVDTLQSTVSELVTELFHLLGSGEAGFQACGFWFLLNVFWTLGSLFWFRPPPKLSNGLLVHTPGVLTWITTCHVVKTTLWGKLDNLPHDLLPWPTCINWKQSFPFFSLCLPRRPSVRDLAHRLRSNGDSWGSMTALERWAAEQPWSFLMKSLNLNNESWWRKIIAS